MINTILLGTQCMCILLATTPNQLGSSGNLIKQADAFNWFLMFLSSTLSKIW